MFSRFRQDPPVSMLTVIAALAFLCIANSAFSGDLEPPTDEAGNQLPPGPTMHSAMLFLSSIEIGPAPALVAPSPMQNPSAS